MLHVRPIASTFFFKITLDLMSQLDAHQRQALAQLQDLTNGGDDEVAISVLDSVGWDVQVTFQQHTPPNPRSPNP